MRSRKVQFLVISFLVMWSFITYYILLRNSNANDMTMQQQQQVKRLLPEALREDTKSLKLTRTLVEFLKFKYAGDQDQQTTTTPKISIVAAEISNELPEQALDKVMPATLKTTPAQIPNKTYLANGEPVIPILVFACNRVSVEKCLDNLVEYRPSIEQFPIIVSQDCGDERTKQVIQSFGSQVTLIEQPDLTDIFVLPKEKKFKGYYKIARHYGWALNTTFQIGFDFVVIVEDDLNVAPDFFEYFLGTHKLLKQDSSLWCVSAWNDNGKANVVDTSTPELLYRTDFFPGLGWMLTKELWAELSIKWPKSFWDDWIRHPEQRKDRVCIRPEISRTRTFGKIGVSNGLFFDKYLKHIKLSEDFVQFSKINTSYLLKENYDKTFLKQIYVLPLVTFEELRRNLIAIEGPVRIQYNTRDQYKRITRMLGLMDDFKSGVPRTAYHGIVSFYYNKRRVHLAPSANWKGYDLSWS
ncbi:alpha-1,3-mannosyl-glycoprotein 2-beta-N-acetylglucosaminyltransferase [Drosophila grimshawi]|uniref:Alpha-1,3-mannosyl-glycoprotein 2-beta-N-acetylglucosaminyltransferase n=1 Tax=Drosophila grimshawi TaxID=7222 RepID=B4J469_DROGR|nr:alpha-1,3-mannosyl-glycoprotein 2-beta-N-acetylglucosaminyltransferase [Drosophila grimshawi]EDW02675.1 GH22116 [Drosophila grimshawi]